MNTQLDIFINKLLNIEDTLTDYVVDLCSNELENVILNLNKEQIFSSKETDESQIKYTYSEKTEQIYKGETFTFNGVSKQKIEGEPYFLYDTSLFFDSFAVIPENKDISIYANTIKVDKRGQETDLLQYGKKIIGLSEKHSNLLTDKYIIPELLSFLKKYL